MSEPDLSEFYELSKDRGKKPLCKVGLAVTNLSEDDAAALTAAFEACREGKVRVGAIQAWFEKRKESVSGPAVINHRDGRCTCASDG